MTIIDTFIAHMQQQGKTEKTLSNYRDSLNRFVKWINSSIIDTPAQGDGGLSLLKKVSQMDVAIFKRSMLENYKPSTVSQTLIHVSKLFDWLVANSDIIDNPAKHIDRVTVEVKAPKWLTRNEQNSLIRTIRQHGDIRELTIVTLLLHTGLRVDELVNVKVSDVIVSERKGKVVVRNGKNSKRREVPLNIDARRILSDYLAQVQPKGEYLFDSQRSEQMTTRAVQHLIERYRKLTNIDGLTAHSLRHSFGHELISHGLSLDVVARLMGHVKEDGTPNLQMTSRYTLPDENDLQAAVENLSWV